MVKAFKLFRIPLAFVALISSNWTLAERVACSPTLTSDLWECAEYRQDVSEAENHRFLQEPLNAYDWVPEHALTDAQKSTLSPGCHGLYIDPLAKVKVPTEISDAELIVEADKSSVKNGEIFVIEGNVEVKHGPRSINADSMAFDRSQEEARLEGKVKIRNPGILIRGGSARISTRENEAAFNQALFVMHEQHLRGSAAAIEQRKDGVVLLKKGSVTSCEPGNNIWSIDGGEIKLDQNKHLGTAKGVSLKIADIPVMYLPWFSFPLGDQRQSGLLVPAISSSEDGGLDIALPYYWNIAPNYDMTITPRLVSGRGAMLETENRYMNKSFTGNLNLAYLADDDGGQDPDVDSLIESGELTESQARPHIGNNRWLIEAQQSGGMENAEGWYSELDYSKVSDVDYFRDVGNTSFSQSNISYISQVAQLGYLSDTWHFQILGEDRQVLLSDLEKPYRILPRISFDGAYGFGRLKLKLDHEITQFAHIDDERDDGSPILTGNRYYLDYRLNRPSRKSWGFFVPEVGYKYLAYGLDEASLKAGASDSPAASAAQASLDMGLVFEKEGSRFLQTLEPRVFHFYREYTNQNDLYDVTADGQNINFDTSLRTFTYEQLYRDTRFNGHDRLDDADRTTIGLTTRWIDNKDGHEFFSASVGQIFHHRTRRVTLSGEPQLIKSSEFAGHMSIALGPLSRIYANGLYNTENKELSRAATGVRFASSDQKVLLNLAYSWVRDFEQQETNSANLDQIDTSVVFPLGLQWHIMARYNYDLAEKQNLESFLGLEYNDCCYRIRALARRWLDSNIATLTDDEDLRHDQGIFFEFHLKGLGGSGARVNAILSDSIPGYQIRENTLNK